MKKFMRPDRFDVDPSSAHWHRTFTYFLDALTTEATQPNRLNLLINYVAPSVYEFIADCDSHEDAVNTLKELYIKPKKKIFARHVLATRCQEAGETLDQYLQALNCSEQAHALEMAQKQSISYMQPVTINAAMATPNREAVLNLPQSASPTSAPTDQTEQPVTVAAANLKCFFCGLGRHPRSKCPARDVLCLNC
ncbi:uncharacterized protein LOC121862513 [Homarus americanus]|uniref:uncharacterized protein LOC121862513 n=1 Tax=Homarus americanus TaxID=6706 RepID=UPI001C475E1C|nr:uncharacterized protein LOC121862513 [Homarus americanus]